MKSHVIVSCLIYQITNCLEKSEKLSVVPHSDDESEGWCISNIVILFTNVYKFYQFIQFMDMSINL